MGAAVALFAPPLQTIDDVDLGRLGDNKPYYEVFRSARTPPYEEPAQARNCTITYRYDEHCQTLHVSTQSTVDGQLHYLHGEAIVDPEWQTAGRLLVRFVPNSTHIEVPSEPRKLWIVALAEDYSYVAVSSECRSYLRVLARGPSLDEFELRTIVNELYELNYFTYEQLTSLVRTSAQPEHVFV